MPMSEPIDEQMFRRVMGRFASGVTVILAAVDGEVRGMTANAFMSGSLKPPLCVVSVGNEAHMHSHLTTARAFSINILSDDQAVLANYFAGRRSPSPSITFGCLHETPIVEGCVATIVTDLHDTFPCGDHTLFVGHTRALSASERRPLLYYASQLFPISEQ